MKKAKKAPRKQTWRVILSSLFSNNAVVEGGRHRAWYIALIMLVLGTTAALAPSMISIGKTSGADIMSSPQYSFENGRLEFAKELNTKSVSLKVVSEEEDGVTNYRLKNVGDNWNSVFEDKTTVNSTDYHYYSYSANDGEKLRVYYVPLGTDDPATTDDEGLSGYSNLLEYLSGLTYDSTNEEAPGTKPVSFIVFGESTYRVTLYNPTTVTKGSEYEKSLAGLYTKKLVDLDFKDFVIKDVNGNSIVGLDENAATFSQYRAGVDSNYKNFFIESYRTVKTMTFWTNVGVFAGTYVSISLAMGLIIFIMTRGKTSPTRDWTFWQSMAISFWATLSPGLLTFIIGLLMPQYASMAFIMLLGMRIMWMSMKQIRPPVTR